MSGGSTVEADKFLAMTLGIVIILLSFTYILDVDKSLSKGAVKNQGVTCFLGWWTSISSYAIYFARHFFSDPQ